MQELTQIYNSYINGEPVSLPILSIQYSDYAIWQRECLSEADLETFSKYWKEHLSDVPHLHSIPLDKPRSNYRSYEGQSYRFELDEEFTHKLKRFCKYRDITLFMFLHSVLALLISRYSDEKDIVIGSPISGRTRSEIQHLIGMFVNNLVIRSDVNGELFFDEFLQKNKQIILDGYSHQHIPYDLIVETLSLERSLSYNPLFQILLSVQNLADVEFEMKGLDVKPIKNDFEHSKFDIELSVGETDAVSYTHLTLPTTPYV